MPFPPVFFSSSSRPSRGEWTTPREIGRSTSPNSCALSSIEVFCWCRPIDGGRRSRYVVMETVRVPVAFPDAIVRFFVRCVTPGRAAAVAVEPPPIASSSACCRSAACSRSMGGGVVGASFARGQGRRDARGERFALACGIAARYRRGIGRAAVSRASHAVRTRQGRDSHLWRSAASPVDRGRLQVHRAEPRADGLRQRRRADADHRRRRLAVRAAHGGRPRVLRRLRCESQAAGRPSSSRGFRCKRRDDFAGR